MYRIYLVLCYLLFTILTSFACTGFYICRNEKIYAGNNEDFYYPLTKMWVVPGDNENYGRIFFGYDDYFPQGGINEKGLFFDGYATKYLHITKSPDKLNYNFIYDVIQNEILSTCSSVDEVISFLNNYNLGFLENSMLFFGDAFGNSVIIEGDSIIFKNKDYQIITNFHQSQTDEIVCDRFNTANRMLSINGDVSVEYCRDILDSTHVEKQFPTLYSQVYDISNMKIYMYNFHNYNETIIIDIQEEFKNGFAYYDLPLLFSNTSKYDKFKDAFLLEINQEIARRQLIRPMYSAEFKGKYRLKKVERPNKVIIADSYYFATIDIKEYELIYMEQYGRYFKCNLIPDSNNQFFYKTIYGEFRIMFPKHNSRELICEAIFQNSKKHKWIYEKIE